MDWKKILMIAGDYTEDYELMVPFQALKMIGHKVDVVCPEKNKGEKIKTVIHDPRDDQTYIESRGHDFKLNKSFKEVDLEEYDGLVLPGGRAPEYLSRYKRVIEIIQHFFAEDKPVGAVCHGNKLLAAADVLEGKKCSSHPTVKADVKNSGGEWIEDIAVDGNLATVWAWPDQPEWLSDFLDLLENKKIKKTKK